MKKQTQKVTRNQGTDALPFARILAQLMKDRRLTIKAVAELAGVRTSVVQNWLSGAVPHDLFAVNRLSSSLGISFKEFLLGEQEGKNIKGVSSFDECDLFDGICHVNIKRMIPRS